MSTEHAVVVENLNVWIRGRRILENISFRVPANTIFAIMGPSGSGKSTLLRVLNRLVDLIPECKVEGKILLHGVDALRSDPLRVRRLTGMVFQEPNPFPHLSIYDNIALGPRLNGLSKDKKALRKRVEWALKKAMLWDEVKDRLHEPPTVLSGGQKQRLCLARALALKPKILLLDEPTANLDPENTKKIENVLKDLKKETTIILVTHSPPQALRVADYTAILYMGKLAEMAPTRELFENPRNPITKKILRMETVMNKPNYHAMLSPSRNVQGSHSIV